jgi:hypothetical protein
MPSFLIPPWLKIVGPIVILLLIVAGVMLYGSSKYRAGKADGVAETDAKWQAASEQLRKDAAASATRADDAAVVRLEEHVEQAKEDQEKLDEATRTGTSPLDALFGG